MQRECQDTLSKCCWSCLFVDKVQHRQSVVSETQGLVGKRVEKGESVDGGAPCGNFECN